MTVFSLRAIVKRWQGMTDPVLDGVDLRLAPGEAVGVHGRNGSGRSYSGDNVVRRPHRH